MKKFLLLISCLFALGASSAQAEEYTWEVTSTTKVTDISKGSFSYTSDNVKWSFTHESYGSSWHGQRSGSDLQFGSKANPTKLLSLSTDAFKDKKIISVKLNAAKRGNQTDLSLSVFNGETEVKTQSVTATTKTDYVFEINEVFSNDLKIAFTNSNSATNNSNNTGVLFHSVSVTYELADTPPAAVETPAISIDDQNMVSITCETEGAEIHYTINGDDPTADSQKYDAPFELTESATVKAIAIKGEDKSNIASKSFTVVEKKNSLANWTEWEEDVTFNITCPLTVIYKNGNNIFVKDAYNNYALVFNQNRITLPDYQNGDVINGMTAKFIVYSNSQLPEIIPVTVGEKTAGEPVIATEITATDVTAENFCHYVSLTGVSIVAGTQNKYFTLTDSEGVEATVYNQFNLDFTPEEGAVYDVIGVISAFKGQYQLQPVEITRALPEGGLDFTVENIENDSFVIGKDVESAKITVSGVHAESELYCKFTAAPAENPESAPRKAVDHTGYEKIERDADNNHTITVDGAGTLELYTYHPATDSKSDIRTINVTKEDGTTAIDAIASDVADGEAEYFNLQGVRINPENAAPGLYIRRQCGKAAKVMVK